MTITVTRHTHLKRREHRWIFEYDQIKHQLVPIAYQQLKAYGDRHAPTWVPMALPKPFRAPPPRVRREAQRLFLKTLETPRRETPAPISGHIVILGPDETTAVFTLHGSQVTFQKELLQLSHAGGLFPYPTGAAGIIVRVGRQLSLGDLPPFLRTALKDGGQRTINF
jgi:hypothetical protein